MSAFLPHPGPQRLGEYLLEQLRDAHWEGFSAAVAFVKASGVKHIEASLREFSLRAPVRMAVGVDLGGTSVEGLQRLLAAVPGEGGVWVFHNETHSHPTFHPKIYLFYNEQEADLLVGSGNLTQGGLYTNYEAGLRRHLDLTLPDDRAVFDQVTATLSAWTDETSGNAHRLTNDFLLDLIAQRYVVPERLTRPDADADAAPEAETDGETEGTPRAPLFTATPVAGAPAVAGAVRRDATADGPRAGVAARRVADGGPGATVNATAAGHVGYVMTLQTTDVGYGQTTAGAQRRSAEIFVPLEARDLDPDFWGWDGAFTLDPNHIGKKDRTVTLRLGADAITAAIYNWPPKHDFRIRTEALRRGASVGDILRLERAAGPGYDYYAEIVPQGTTLHATYLALCTHAVRNSLKRWGYY
jgi:hypothetical protein